MLSWIVVQGCFPSSMKKRCKSLTRRSFQIGHVQLSSDVPLASLFLLIFLPSSSTFLNGFYLRFYLRRQQGKFCETFRKFSPFLSAWPRCEERGGRVDCGDDTIVGGIISKFLNMSAPDSSAIRSSPTRMYHRLVLTRMPPKVSPQTGILGSCRSVGGCTNNRLP